MRNGSLQNLMLSNGRDGGISPVVGMGGTVIMWTDREPVTVVEVLSPSRVVVQEDNATRTDSNGMSDSQAYTFSPHPEGRRRTFSLRRNGRWIEVGGSQDAGTCLRLGTRGKYHDYSF